MSTTEQQVKNEISARGLKSKKETDFIFGMVMQDIEHGYTIAEAVSESELAYEQINEDNLKSFLENEIHIDIGDIQGYQFNFDKIKNEQNTIEDFLTELLDRTSSDKAIRKTIINYLVINYPEATKNLFVEEK